VWTQRNRPHDQRGIVGPDLGVSVRAATEYCTQRLLVVASPPGDEVAHQVGQDEPAEVGGQAQTPEDRLGVGTRVGHRTTGVQPQEAVADPRGVGVVAALTCAREVAPSDHLRQVGRALEVGELQVAGGPHTQQVRVAGHHGDDLSQAEDRDGLHAHRNLVAPFGVALAHEPAGGEGLVDHRAPACGDEDADDVVDVRRGAGCRSHLRRRPEAGTGAVGQPQHEVGEGQVRDDLPVCLQELQPGDVGITQVGVAAHQVGQGRHDDSLGPYVVSSATGRRSAPGEFTGRMSAMRGSYWKQVTATGLRVPSDRSLAELTTELTTMLGDPDPETRDALALPTLATWIDRGVYDDLLIGLGDGMAAGLDVALGESGSDTVFRRSYSVLVLASCLSRDNERPLVPGPKVLEWGDRVMTWLLRERDVRGWVPGKGWAHAVAHGADALGALAESPHLASAELSVILDVIADRLVLSADQVFSSGEHDRLAATAVRVLRRDVISMDAIESWVARLADAAGVMSTPDDRDPFLVGGNAQGFLRALHLQLAIGLRPPQQRADLLLQVIEALKASNPHYLQPPTRPVSLPPLP